MVCEGANRFAGTAAGLWSLSRPIAAVRFRPLPASQDTEPPTVSSLPAVPPLLPQLPESTTGRKVGVS